MKKIGLFFLTIGMSLGIMACGGPSEEKIEQAQAKFNELVETHNKTVEVHNEIDDNYLDQDLQAMAEQVTALRDYNLVEMTEEEIDVIIEEMGSAIEKYEETIVLLTEKKQEEADAVLKEIPLTLHNQTGKVFKELYLLPEGEKQKENVLSETLSINEGETLAGLYIYKDIEAKPWKIVLADEQGETWEIEIAMVDLDEKGVTFFMQYDSESETIILNNSDFSENSIDKSEEEL